MSSDNNSVKMRYRFDEEEECALMQRAREGDRDALTKLFLAYRPELNCRCRLKWNIPEQDVHDVVMDAYVKALRQIERVPPKIRRFKWVGYIWVGDVCHDYVFKLHDQLCPGCGLKVTKRLREALRSRDQEEADAAMCPSCGFCFCECPLCEAPIEDKQFELNIRLGSKAPFYCPACRGVLNPTLEAKEGLSVDLPRLADKYPDLAFQPDDMIDQRGHEIEQAKARIKQLQFAFGESSRPHEAITWYLRTWGPKTPSEIAADQELIHQPLQLLIDRIFDQMLSHGLNMSQAKTVLEPTRSLLKRKVKEVIGSDPTTEREFALILEIWAGETCLADYFGVRKGKERTAAIYRWVENVVRRAKTKAARMREPSLERASKRSSS